MSLVFVLTVVLPSCYTLYRNQIPTVNWSRKWIELKDALSLPSFRGNDMMNHTCRNILTVPPHRLLSCCRHLNNTKRGGTDCVKTEKRAEKGNSRPANVFIPMHLPMWCEKWVCMLLCPFQQVARYFLSGCFCVEHFRWSKLMRLMPLNPTITVTYTVSLKAQSTAK